MSRLGRKFALAASAGAALFAAAPASATTVALYYGSYGEIIGYINYGNDGHVCSSYCNTAGLPDAIWHVDGDC
jgi:hypothetical protein